ncbi:MAG: DUF2752 domain-containing protein [Clostridia bacterium]|nr:DUF2752 domain-containing protein [Clostridia bacterium]
MIKLIRKSLLLCLTGCFFAFIYKCPFRILTQTDCPACGITRAFLCALKGDFISAFNYHPLFALLGIETLYYIVVYYYEFYRLKIKDRYEIYITVFTGLLLIIIWIKKIFFY